MGALRSFDIFNVLSNVDLVIPRFLSIPMTIIASSPHKLYLCIKMTVFLFFLLIAAVACQQEEQLTGLERLALFYKGLNGTYWQNNTLGWHQLVVLSNSSGNISTPVCDWFGTYCDFSTGTVLEGMSLRGNNTIGTVYPAIYGIPG